MISLLSLPAELLFPVMLALSYLPGLLVVISLTDDNREAAALALPVSFALFAFSTLPSLYFEWPFFPLSHICALLIAATCSLTLVARKRRCLADFLSFLNQRRRQLLTYSLILFLLLAHQSLVPVYGLGSLPGDWFGHYRITWEFLNGQNIAFPDRLPLYQLIHIFSLSLAGANSFGENFWLFQLMQIVIGFSFFPVAHLLFAQLFRARYNMMYIALLALLPHFLVQTIFTWPKALAAVYALLSYYFYQKINDPIPQQKHAILSGLFDGLGIFVHWSAAAYFLALCADAFWRRTRGAQSMKFSLKIPLLMALSASIVILPIVIWGVKKFDLHGVFSPIFFLAHSGGQPFGRRIFIRMLNLASSTFVPIALFIGFFREAPAYGLSSIAVFDIITRELSWRFGSLSGNLGLSVMITVIKLLAARYRRYAKGLKISLTRLKSVLTMRNTSPSFKMFTIGGFFIWLIIQSYPHTYGVSFTGLLPTACLLVGYVFSRLSLEALRKVSFLICIESCLVLLIWQTGLFFIKQYPFYYADAQTTTFRVIKEVVGYTNDYTLTFLCDAIKIPSLIPLMMVILLPWALLLFERKRLR